MTASKQQKVRREAWKSLFLTARRRNYCWHPDLRLSASSTVRQYIPAVSSHPGCGSLSQSPWETYTGAAVCIVCKMFSNILGLYPQDINPVPRCNNLKCPRHCQVDPGGQNCLPLLSTTRQQRKPQWRRPFNFPNVPGASDGPSSGTSIRAYLICGSHGAGREGKGAWGKKVMPSPCPRINQTMVLILLINWLMD